MSVTDEELGRVAYEAALKAADAAAEDPRRFEHRSIWNDDAVLRSCWIAAAKAVREQIESHAASKEILKQKAIERLTCVLDLTEEFGVEIWDEELLERLRKWFLGQEVLKGDAHE